MGFDIRKSLSATNICLVIFLFAFLYAALHLSDGYLEHSPPGPFFLARDTLYSSQLIADVLDHNGFTRAAYASGGAPSYYYRPPLFGATGALLSRFTGINEYDIGFFLVLFFVFSMAAIIYAVTSRYSRVLAVFSLPLAIFFFTVPFNFSATWGRWPSTLNVLFLFYAMLVYAFTKFDRPLLLGLILGFGFMSHVKESVYFAALIIPIWLVYEYLSKYLDFRTFAKLVIAYLVALAVFIGFFPYSVEVVERSQDPFISFQPNAYAGRMDVPMFSNLKIFGFLAVAGLILGFALFMKKRKRNFDVPFLFSVGFLLLTFIGVIVIPFKKGITQDRFFWPLALSVLCGVFFYSIYVFLASKKKIPKAAIILFIFACILVLVFVSVDLITIPNNIITNKDTWDSLMWMKENTSEDARFVALYGDNMDMDAIFWPSKRVVYVVSWDDYAAGLANMTMYFSFKPHTLENYAVRNGLFDFEIKNPNDGFDRLSLCGFDYLYIQRSSPYRPDLIQYNLLLASQLASKKNFTIEYYTDMVIILKNPTPGGECLSPAKIDFGEQDE